MKFILLLLLTINVFQLYSKSERINTNAFSIQNKKNSKNKVIILNNLASQTLNSNKTKSLQYSIEALILSTKLDFKKGIAQASLNIGKIEKINNNKLNSIKYLNSALNLFKELEDTENYLNTLFEINEIYYKEAKFNQILNNYTSLLKSLKFSKKTISIGETYNLLGKSNANLGNNPDALFYFLESYKIFSFLKDERKLCDLNYNIGSLYQIIEKPVKAKYHLSKLLKIAKKINYKKGIALSYYNIGNILLKEGNYKEALINITKSLVVANKYEKTNLSPLFYEAIYYDLAEINFKLKKYTEAKSKYLFLLSMSIQNDNPPDIALAYNGLGNIAEINKDYVNAKIYYQKSLNILLLIHTKDKISESYLCLFELSKKMNDLKKALFYYDKYIIYRDSVFSDENKLKINEIQLQYENQQKNIADSVKNIQKLKIKNFELAIVKTNIKKEHLKFWFIVFIVLLSLTTLFIILNRFRIINKQKIIINKQHHQIIESINYSKKIQDTLLPDIETIELNLKNTSLFYNPKHVVSGDFYWYKRIKDSSIIICIDSSKNGVPGSITSAITSLIMDKIITTDDYSPSEIIIIVKKEIAKTLKQNDQEENLVDVDLSICILNHNNNKIAFSGTKNDISIIRQNKVLKLNFQLRTLNLNDLELLDSDWIYIYTNGFMKQIGGTNNLPLNAEQYKKILISNSSKKNKTDHFSNELSKWRGKNEKTDDILVICFQLNTIS